MKSRTCELPFKVREFDYVTDLPTLHRYKQMFRCYAHLYWAHWLTFWDLECYRELNTCFVHFNNVGRRFGLISDKDTEPMQGLINLWVQQGVLPKMVTDGAAQASGPSGGSASKDSAAVAGPSSEK